MSLENRHQKSRDKGRIEMGTMEYDEGIKTNESIRSHRDFYKFLRFGMLSRDVRNEIMTRYPDFNYNKTLDESNDPISDIIDLGETFKRYDIDENGKIYIRNGY